MRILRKMRKMDAIYWAPGPVNDFGQRTYATAQQIRVRWEDRQEEFIDASGNTQISKSVVYVPGLENGAEVEPLGVLWLGKMVDLVPGSETNPFLNVNADEVRSFSKIPTLNAREFIRRAIL
jgi:hypothetical protein